MEIRFFLSFRTPTLIRREARFPLPAARKNATRLTQPMLPPALGKQISCCSVRQGNDGLERDRDSE